MLSHPPPEEAPDAARLRSNLFTDLDRLAFALELESSALLRAGKPERARERQAERLGVRLAQRLVAGIWADEVNLRTDACAEEYAARLGGVSA